MCLEGTLKWSPIRESSFSSLSSGISVSASLKVFQSWHRPHLKGPQPRQGHRLLSHSRHEGPSTLLWITIANFDIASVKKGVCFRCSNPFPPHFWLVCDKKGDKCVQTWHVLATVVVHKVTVAGKGSDGWGVGLWFSVAVKIGDQMMVA